MTPGRTEAAATMQGLVAVLLWAALAALTTYAGPIPPFQLAAITFAIASLVGVGFSFASGESVGPVFRTMPLGALALGVYGLLAFHACYFYALQQAPAIEVSLIICVWPLLMVLGSALLPSRHGGMRLGWRHIAGAAVAFAGTLIVVSGAAGRADFSGNVSGYVAAVAAAVIWSSYSVASRIYRGTASSALIASCTVTAIGSAIMHAVFETTAWPVNAGAWAAVIGLGLGPVGLAFYVWDRGMKFGNMRLLGTVAYATPLLSTLLLASLGLGTPSSILWLAALLITAGALIASTDTSSSLRGEDNTSKR